VKAMTNDFEDVPHNAISFSIRVPALTTPKSSTASKAHK